MSTSVSDLEIRPAVIDDVPADKALVMQFKTGSSDAYDEIFERYRPLATSICLRILGNRDDAEEAVQETMLRVLRGLPNFNGRYQLQAWIARIATNVSVDMVRARGRRPQSALGLHDLRDEAVADPALDPEILVEQIFDQERVRSTLDELPSHHREALVLREFEGRSHEEIGDALGVSPAQAKALIHRAKGTFRRAWAGEDQRGIAAFLPWFLIPALFRRLGGAAHTVATRVSAAPAVTEATASTAEKITAAAVAVVVAGTVGVGAFAARHVPRAPVSPVPTHAAIVPAPVPPVSIHEVTPPVRSRPKPVHTPKKHHHKNHVATPPTTPTPAPTPDPSPTPTPDPSPPPVVLGPAPEWVGAFGINWASDDVCDCTPGLNMFSNQASGKLTADGGLDIVQEYSGAALDAEGDAAWALSAGIGAHMGTNDGHLNLTFSLGSGSDQYAFSGYAASASSVTGVPGDGNPVVYSFLGTYVLEGGDPATSPIRTSGQFQVLVSVWGDGTSVFITQIHVL